MQGVDSFIEQLYFGNINPQARCFPKGSRAEKAASAVSSAEEQIKEHLPEEAQHLLDEYCSAYSDLISLSCRDAFAQGFRLGAKMAVDTFLSDAAPFEEIR